MKVKLLNVNATVPTRNNPTDAGLDFYAAEKRMITAGSRILIGTGIAVAIPKGKVGFLKSRSGLASKSKLDTEAGVIDSSYRGEVKVLLHNVGEYAFHVFPGDRIAQMVVAKVEQPKFEVVEDLSDTDRGEGGFGSTGIKIVYEYLVDIAKEGKKLNHRELAKKLNSLGLKTVKTGSSFRSKTAKEFLEEAFEYYSKDHKTTIMLKKAFIL